MTMMTASKATTTGTMTPILMMHMMCILTTSTMTMITIPITTTVMMMSTLIIFGTRINTLTTTMIDTDPINQKEADKVEN